MNKFINTTLQLKDENIIFEDKVEEMTVKNIKSLIYFDKLDVNPQYCPACGCIKQGNSIVKNGSKKSRITITKISGLPAYLELRKQRYHCRECDSYFTAKSEIVGENCFISKRVKRMVLDFATNALTLKHSIFDALPEHIAFDEFKGVKHAEGNMSFVFIDNTNSQIVDVLGDSRKFKLRDYFFAYPLKTRQKVQTVTMDMYMPYMEVLREVFPNAKIIIDRFHLIQALNRELNKLRIEVMNTFRVPDHRLYNKYKGYWRLFLMARESLSSWDYQSFNLFDWLTNTGGILDYLLDKNPL